MQLTALQEAFGKIIWEKAGHGVLHDDAAWQDYAKTPYGQIVARYPKDRLALYEELLFNSVEDTMSAFYPSCKRFIEEDWRAFVEEYRRTYPNRSFEFHRCAQAFPQFISEQADLVEIFPFLPDLAHYEWLEMDVYHAPNEPLPTALTAKIPTSVEELATLRPVKNPIARLRAYDYPVPQIVEWLASFEGMPAGRVQIDPAPCQVLTYRDPESHEARYFQVNPLTGALWEALTHERTYQEILDALQAELPQLQAVSRDVLYQEGLKLIQKCFEEQILLGSIPQNA